MNRPPHPPQRVPHAPQHGPHMAGHHREREPRANPAMVALGVVGAALLAAFIIILAGRRGGTQEPAQDVVTTPEDRAAEAETKLQRAITNLKLLTGPSEKRVAEAERLLPQAKRESDKIVVSQLRLQFLLEKEREDIEALKKLRESITTLMDKVKFTEALEAVDAFERNHDFLLKGYVKLVPKLAGEVAALRTEVQQTRDAQFQKDMALLKTAADKDDPLDMTDVLGRILEYGTAAMTAQAKELAGKAGNAIERLRNKEIAALEGGDARVQAPEKAPSPLPPKGTPDEPAPEDIAPDPEPAKETPKDNPDDFFGPSKASEELKVFTQVTIAKDGTCTVTANKSKATLVFPSSASIFMDTVLDSKRYAENLVPSLPVLTYAELKTIPLDNDPTNGRRVVNLAFMLMGDGIPDKYTYQDPSPKRKNSTWHKGTFSRRVPQVIFQLSGSEYLAQGEPDIVIKRKKVTIDELPRATFAIFVAGKAEGLGAATPGKLEVRRLVVLPASAAVNTAIYRALLQE